MKLIISILIFTVFCFACKKDKPDCEENGYGWLRYTNTSSYAQNVYIDQAPPRYVKANDSWLASLSPGTHTFKLVRYNKIDSSVQEVSITQCDSIKIFK